MCTLSTTDRLLIPSHRTISHCTNFLFAYPSLFFSIACFTLSFHAMLTVCSLVIEHKIMERQVGYAGQKTIVRYMSEMNRTFKYTLRQCRMKVSSIVLTAGYLGGAR